MVLWRLVVKAHHIWHQCSCVYHQQHHDGVPNHLDPIARVQDAACLFDLLFFSDFNMLFNFFDVFNILWIIQIGNLLHAFSINSFVLVLVFAYNHCSSQSLPEGSLPKPEDACLPFAWRETMEGGFKRAWLGTLSWGVVSDPERAWRCCRGGIWTNLVENSSQSQAFGFLNH